MSGRERDAEKRSLEPIRGPFAKGGGANLAEPSLVRCRTVSMTRQISDRLLSAGTGAAPNRGYVQLNKLIKPLKQEFEVCLPARFSPVNQGPQVLVVERNYESALV